jgi:hypothetical protein
MENHPSENKLKKLETEKRQISILRSGHTEAIIDTIQEIRKKGSVSILPELFDLLLVSLNEEVIQACSSLLNDLKNKESVQYLVTALKDERYEPVRHILTSACWQNGLDYHGEIQLFAEILLNDNYATALEAFTVIENSIGDLTDRDLLLLTEKLNHGIDLAKEDKKPLIRELLSLIKSY